MEAADKNAKSLKQGLMCIGFLLAHLVARKFICVDALTTPLASASMCMLAATKNVGRKDILRLCADLHPSH